MKVKTYDEIEPELIGIGQTTNRSASLRKEAILETNGRTRKEEKRIATAIREKKNTSKGKVSSHTKEQSLERTSEQKATSRALKSGRKNNIKTEKPELEEFVLEEPKKNEKKYPSQSKIGLPSKKIIREVNKELSEKYGLEK